MGGEQGIQGGDQFSRKPPRGRSVTPKWSKEKEIAAATPGPPASNRETESAELADLLMVPAPVVDSYNPATESSLRSQYDLP